MNLQDQIAEELASGMQSSIDFEILADVLCRFGWHKVDLETFHSREHSVDVVTWVQDNARGDWKRNGRHFIFENIGDAVNFTMRWKC